MVTNANISRRKWAPNANLDSRKRKIAKYEVGNLAGQPGAAVAPTLGDMTKQVQTLSLECFIDFKQINKFRSLNFNRLNHI